MPDSNLSSPETAALVLDYLAKKPTSSIRAIAAGTGIGRNTALNAIRRLSAEGSLKVHRLGTGAGYPTIYQVR